MDRTQSPFAAFSDDAFMFGGLSPFMSAEDDDLYARWQAQPAAERGTFLVDTIRARVATALDIATEAVAVDVALNSFVTDSLMVARLHNNLMAGRIDMPLLQFWQQTINELATEINRQLALVNPDAHWDETQACKALEEVPRHLQDEGWHPISQVQQLYYNAFQQCKAENPAFLQMHQALQIHSPVNIPALQCACQTFVDRHEGVRIIFTTHEGRCYQKVRTTAEADFLVIDAQECTEKEIQQAIARENTIPWDLANDLGVKFRLYTRSEQEHLFHIFFNHLVMDGWAFFVMLDELQRLYRASTTGVAAALPPVGWSLLEYNRWQAARLHGAEGERLWRYWQKELAGELTEMKLPTDYPASSAPTLRGEELFMSLDLELYQGIKRFIAQEKITYFAFFLAVLQLLFYKYSGQPEVRLVTRLSNRTKDETINMMAAIANFGLLRVHLSDDMTIQELIALAQEKAIEGLAHQGYPLLTLADRLGIEMGTGAAPLARVQYNFERVHLFPQIAQLFDPNQTEPIEFGGLMVESYPHLGTAAWEWTDLAFYFMEGSHSLVAIVGYNPALFKLETIERMISDIKLVSKVMVTDPQSRIGGVQIRGLLCC